MPHGNHFWELILGTVVALLPIIDPFAAAPVFLAITGDSTPEQRWLQARKGCFYMVGILIAFLVGGTFIMSFFGISIPGLRIAGGILIFGIGMDMLRPRQTVAQNSEEQEAARQKEDISFSPLAMPMLSGPGSIAVTIGFTSLAVDWLDYLAIILGILIVAVITYVTLRLSGKIVRMIGVNGMHAFTKIMGFLLLCIGIQFVVNGILGIGTDPTVLKSIRDALG